MTGDGPPLEPAGSSTDWSDDRLRAVPEPPGPTEPRRNGPNRTRRPRDLDGGADRPLDADEPDGRLADEPDDGPVEAVRDGVDGPDDRQVDELEARLSQQETTLQNVVDRYEAILEEQQTAGADRREADDRQDGLLDAARERAERFLTDVRIVVETRWR